MVGWLSRGAADWLTLESGIFNRIRLLQKFTTKGCVFYTGNLSSYVNTLLKGVLSDEGFCCGVRVKAPLLMGLESQLLSSWTVLGWAPSACVLGQAIRNASPLHFTSLMQQTSLAVVPLLDPASHCKEGSRFWPVIRTQEEAAGWVNPVASQLGLNGGLVDLFGICQRERSHFQWGESKFRIQEGRGSL